MIDVTADGFTIQAENPTLQSVANGSNINLNLGGIDTTDTVTLGAGTNVTFTSVTAGGFTINAQTTNPAAGTNISYTNGGSTINAANPTLQSASNGANVDLTLGGVAIGDTVTITAGTNINLIDVTAGGFTIQAENPTLQSASDGSNNVDLTLGAIDTTDTVKITAGTNISFDSIGAGGFTINSSNTVSRANNISGGAAGSIPYQSSNNVTTFLAEPNTDNRVLTYNNTSEAPEWKDISVHIQYSSVNTIASGGAAAPTTSNNNALYVLEGPGSVLDLSNLHSGGAPTLGTRLSIISTNVSNRITKPSGVSIQGLNETLYLDSAYASFDLIYTGTSFGWAIK